MAEKSTIKLVRKKDFVYRGIYQKIKHQILNADISNTGAILSESSLVKCFRVSRNSVRRAIAELAKEGLVEKKVGRGTFIRKKAVLSIIGRESNFLFLQTQVQNQIYAEILEHIRHKIRGHGFHLIFQILGELKIEDINVASQIKGIIAVGLRDNKAILELKQKRVPLILVDHYTDDKKIFSVLTDNRKGGYEATKHLVQLGHRRIGIVSLDHGDITFRDRVEGYRDALKEAGIVPDDNLVKIVGYNYKVGFEATKELLTLKNRASAVFVACDLMVFGVLDAVKEQGLAIPADMSVVGYDDQAFARFLWPPLTTIKQPTAEIADRLVILLTNLSQGKLPEKKIYFLPPRLIKRESCSVSNNPEQVGR